MFTNVPVLLLLYEFNSTQICMRYTPKDIVRKTKSILRCHNLYKTSGPDRL